MTCKLMGRKKGMLQRFDKTGELVVCSVIHVEPNVVVQLKTKGNDGYDAVQIGFEKVVAKDARRKENRTPKPQRGHFDKNKIEARRHLFEFRTNGESEYNIGQELGVDLFENMEHVDVNGVSKGKGFQGVIKLYGFAGGPASHGSGFHRRPGSIGMRSTPGRCFPGGKRPTRMGGKNMTVQNLKIVEIDKERNLIIVEGAIPGSCGALVSITKAIKKV